MKAVVFAVLLIFCYVECKKTYAPIDKNANVAFINMEGGGIRPAPRPGVPTAAPASQPAPIKAPSQPAPTLAPKPTPTTQTPKPAQPAHPTTFKPGPVVTPPRPISPIQIKPVPVNPMPAANPITTPGPGSVKDLVNFYNSQGKASPIRPHSYSQAVKQG
uniref:Uncharacterized protein n=1 Tax=Picea sitchensis TaxID=3332 RepID=A9NVX2_PICSI|nr:unknown [Picea sitchensis]